MRRDYTVLAGPRDPGPRPLSWHAQRVWDETPAGIEERIYRTWEAHWARHAGRAVAAICDVAIRHWPLCQQTMTRPSSREAPPT